MANRGRPWKHVYGPSLEDTIEIGDVFRSMNRKPFGIYEISGKIYHDDLSVSYKVIVHGDVKRKVKTLHETSLVDRGGSPFVRIFKIPRKVV